MDKQELENDKKYFLDIKRKDVKNEILCKTQECNKSDRRFALTTCVPDCV